MSCTHDPCNVLAPWPNCIPTPNYDECLSYGFTSNLVAQFNWLLDMLLPRLKTREDIDRCNFVYLSANGRVTSDPLRSLYGAGNCPVGVSITSSHDGYVRIATNGIACVNVIPPVNGFRMGDFVYYDSSVSAFTASPVRISNAVGKIVEIFTSSSQCGNVRVQMGIPDSTKTVGIYNKTSVVIPSPNVIKDSDFVYKLLNTGWYRFTIFDTADVAVSTTVFSKTLNAQGGTLNSAFDIYIPSLETLTITATDDYQLSVERIYD